MNKRFKLDELKYNNNNEYPFEFIYSSKYLDLFALFALIIEKSIVEFIDRKCVYLTKEHHHSFKTKEDGEKFINKINALLDYLNDIDTEIIFEVTKEILKRHENVSGIFDKEKKNGSIHSINFK